MKIAKFSKWGFILSATGSAVGLGNIWKFPYITGEYGGGAFVLLYLLTVLFIGVTLFIGEMFIGFVGQNDAVSSFEKLSNKAKNWKYSGFTFLTGLLILTFYSVVIGWIFYYLFASFTLPDTIKNSEDVFMSFLTKDIFTQLAFYTIVIGIITLVILRGVKQGIEKMNLIMIPMLILILFGLFGYVITLDGFGKAFDFMFSFNFGALKSEAIIIAVGHAFFTLSIGMVVILTYSASLGKDVNIFKTSLIVAGLDTFIAIIAGLVIFGFLFQYGENPSKGAGLVFIVLPKVFNEMGSIGNFVSILFFLALILASLTSAISILEPAVQYLISRFNFSRVKATLSCSILAYFIGIFALLSNSEAFGDDLKFGSKSLFDWFDFISSSILLPLGGLIVAIFIGYIVDINRLKAILQKDMGENIFKIWLFSIKYIAPIGITLVMLNELGLIKLIN
jgi:NSS family neurotransmitter:Na+ symporter